MKTLALIAALAATPVMADERFIQHIDWITAHSEFEYNGEELPTVEFHSVPMLQVIVYGPEAVAMSEYRGTSLPPVEGAYDDDRNVMMLPEGFDFNALETQHIVVHELVHYLQMVNGQNPECHQLLERPAYQLHDEWMVEHNSPADRPNMLFVFMLQMACEENMYGDYDMHR